MSTYHPQQSFAQLQLPSKDLVADMDFLNQLGFRLDKIFPADDPAVAMMSGHGLHLVLDKRHESPPAIVNIITDSPAAIGDGQSSYTAPNGTIYRILPKTQTLISPSTQHKFEVRKLDQADPWVIGRAGMLYRDLIPNRLGGSIIASHIHVPEGGPVPDMVHYHSIGFQLIYCYKGWVKLVYEDQGEPFILKAGDCVTQPPEIRHRVLEASDHLEVIEIGVPAEHMTTIDHDMELPTKQYRPEREFHGQRFVHHKKENALWSPWRIPGLEYRETGILAATQKDANVHIARVLSQQQKPLWLSHDADILFTFVLEGELDLEVEGETVQKLEAGEAYVIPPKMKYILRDLSANLQLLEIALPGAFETSMH